MRKKVIIISLTLLLCALFPVSRPLLSQRPVSEENRACRHLDEGEIDLAIQILQRELKIDPENLNAHLYLGIAYYLKNDLEKSFKELEKIDKELDKMLGSSRPFGDEGMFTQLGMDRKRDILFTEEKKGVLYFFRGLTLKDKKDYKNAEKRFKKAEKSKYDKAAVSLQLIDIHIKNKKIKNATKEIQKYKKIAGETDASTFLDGYIQYMNKNAKVSLAAFQKLEGKMPEAKMNIGCLHYNLGEYQKAVEIWEGILSQNPDLKDAQINLGRAYFHTGDTAKAQEYFNKAGLTISPDRYSPKTIPLAYEFLVKDIKYNLQCK